MVDDFDPHIERRDTSWVEGELATDFAHFPRNGMRRMPLDSRYHLTTPDDFSRVIENVVIDHRNYKQAKYDCENFAFAFKSIVAQRYGLNSVGVVMDENAQNAFNVVVYEDGTTELFDPHKDTIVATGETANTHKGYRMKNGVIVL